MDRGRVLVVEDEVLIRMLAIDMLLDLGCAADEAGTAAEALRLLRAPGADYALVLLDLGLPDLDGADVLAMMRGVTSVPVIVATARDDEDEVVRLLDAGADDYVVKPFDIDELLARVRAVARRRPVAGAGDDGGSASNGPYRFADVVVDPDAWTARRGERVLELTRTEFRLLVALLRRPGRVVGRQELMAEVWGYDFGAGSSNLDVYVSYLRRKLEAAGEPRIVQTARGVGYVVRELA